MMSKSSVSKAISRISKKLKFIKNDIKSQTDCKTLSRYSSYVCKIVKEIHQLNNGSNDLINNLEKDAESTCSYIIYLQRRHCNNPIIKHDSGQDIKKSGISQDIKKSGISQDIKKSGISQDIRKSGISQEMLNSSYLSKLVSDNPLFIFDFVKDRSILPYIVTSKTHITNNNLIMFLPPISYYQGEIDIPVYTMMSISEYDKVLPDILSDIQKALVIHQNIFERSDITKHLKDRLVKRLVNTEFLGTIIIPYNSNTHNFIEIYIYYDTYNKQIKILGYKDSDTQKGGFKDIMFGYTQPLEISDKKIVWDIKTGKYSIDSNIYPEDLDDKNNKKKVSLVRKYGEDKIKEVTNLVFRYRYIVGDNDNLDNSILYHRFRSVSVLKVLEVLDKFFLTCKDLSIISFSKDSSFVEAIMFDHFKTYHDTKLDIKAYIHNFVEEISNKNIVENTYNIKFEDIEDIEDIKDIDKFKPDNKYNMFFADVRSDDISEYNKLFVSMLYKMIISLEIKGNSVFYVSDIRTRSSVDILRYLLSVFSECSLYYPEIDKGYQEKIDVYVICKDFIGKDINNIKNIKKLSEMDSYITQIFKNKDKTIDKDILSFNRYCLEIQSNGLEDIESYLSSKPDIHDLKNYQLTSSKQYAERLDLRIKPLKINNRLFSGDYGRKLLQDMFVLDRGIKFKFRKDFKDPPVSIEISSLELPDIFKKLKSDMYLAQLVIDTRDPKKYSLVKKLSKLYQRSLGLYIKEKLGIERNNVIVSRAWTKMYELLWAIPDIVPDKKVVKSFNLCEAPGGFILALSHYLKTKKDAQLDWYAESLNPKHPKNIKKYGFIFADDFGLMRDFPKRWIWGADGTGDISNAENIRYYKPYCKDVDIITSDCGIQQSQRDEMMDKINFAQFLFVINNLPVNSNCVLKVFAPIGSQKISLLYLMYNRFKNMYIYKPVQNPSSEEFYLVCEGYEGMKNSDINKLFKFLDNYDKSKSVVSKIPKQFELQLEKVMKSIANNYDESIEKKIYYVDNLENLTKYHIKDLNRTILRKNEDWVKEVQLVRSS